MSEKISSHSGPSWLMVEVRKLENRSSRVETAYLTFQGSFEQAYGFCEGDCQRGCRVGVSYVMGYLFLEG